MDFKSIVFITFFINYFVVNNVLAFNCGEDNSVLAPNLTIGESTVRLAKNDSYLDIEVNQTLHLRCEGNEAFSWILPEYHPNFDKLPEFVKIYTKVIKNRFISELIIDEAIAEDVGYYSCHYNTSLHRDSHLIRNKFNSIYVFVTDLSHLFVGHLMAIPAVNNSQVDIGCRPSSSYTQMSLFEVIKHNSSYYEYKELETDNSNGITFDPRTGFQIKQLKSERLQCIARLNETIEKFNISFHFSSGLEYEPQINDNNHSFIFVGNNFTLNCNIRMSESSVLYMKWNFDQVCTQDWKERLYFGELKTNPTANRKLIMTNDITITNAQLTDEGIYKCFAYDLANNYKEVQKFVKIYESAKLELISEYMNQSLKCNQKLIFNVTITSIPNDIKALNLNWTKNGVIIDSNDNKRIQTFRQNSEFVYLVINNTKSEDSALYTLEANLLNILYANISLNLTVRGCRPGLYLKDIKGMDEKSDLFIIIVIFIIFGTILLVMAVFIGQKIREARKHKQELEYLSYNLFESGQVEMINPDLPLDEQTDLLPYDKKWEFPVENLSFGQILGQGAFGRVIRAEALGIEEMGNSSTLLTATTTVAVKTLKERADLSQRKALFGELKILIHIGKHINIVNLLGAVTKNLIKGELLVIVEYCRFGNIRSFLLSRRPDFVNQLDKDNDKIDYTIISLSERAPDYMNTTFLDNKSNEYQNIVSTNEFSVIRDRCVCTSDLISYVYQCAKGMEYLSSKKLIHRDLAARNVLLTEEHVVKICDFGLARDCYNYDNYVKKGEGPLPIKWMAIESMRDKLYTEKSDVWSFGVFMWEIFTLGSNPYPGFDLDEEFYKRLVDGYRMDRPEFAPKEIYLLMKNCWKHEPKDRPDFSTLSTKIKEMMSETNLKKYEKQLKDYMKITFDEYMLMNDNQNQNQSYVDMTVTNNNRHKEVFYANDVAINQTVNHYQYDDLKNVRSIYVNTPMPNEPMEVVPMIQL